METTYDVRCKLIISRILSIVGIIFICYGFIAFFWIEDRKDYYYGYGMETTVFVLAMDPMNIFNVSVDEYDLSYSERRIIESRIDRIDFIIDSIKREERRIAKKIKTKRHSREEKEQARKMYNITPGSLMDRMLDARVIPATDASGNVILDEDGDTVSSGYILDVHTGDVYKQGAGVSDFWSTREVRMITRCDCYYPSLRSAAILKYRWRIPVVFVLFGLIVFLVSKKLKNKIV